MAKKYMKGKFKMSKKIISLLLSLALICSAFVGLGSITASAATTYGVGDVILDFEDSSVYTTDSGTTIVDGIGTVGGSYSAKLANITETIVTLSNPISISSNTLALDVSKIFRTNYVKVTLMNGSTELASSQRSIPNVDSSLVEVPNMVYNPWESNAYTHTLYFTFDGITAETEITAIKFYAWTHSYSSYPITVDNLKVVEATDDDKEYHVDFDDLSNISSITNLTNVSNTNLGSNGGQFIVGPTNTAWGDQTTAGIHFANKITVSADAVYFKVTNVTHAQFNIVLLNGLTVVGQTGWCGDVNTTKDTVKEITLALKSSISNQEVTDIIINHNQYGAQYPIIDNIKFVTNMELNAEAPQITASEIISDSNNEYVNGRLKINAVVSDSAIAKTLEKDGYAISEVGAVVIPTANYSGELTVETEGALSGSISPKAAEYSVVLVNENDYSNVTLAARAYVVWTDGTNTLTLYSDVYETVGADAPTVATKDILMGDVNGDGIINVIDVVAAKKQLVNVAPKNFVFYQADINADNAFNAVDLTNLRRYLLDGFILPESPYMVGDIVLAGDWTIDIVYTTNIVDFEDTTGITLSDNLSVISASDSYNGTFVAQLVTTVDSSNTSWGYGTAEITFDETIYLNKETIAVDVTNVYQTDSFTLKLYSGSNEIASATCSVPRMANIGEGVLTNRNTVNTLYFHVGALNGKGITKITLYAYPYGNAYPSFDNIRAVGSDTESTDNVFADFEDVSKMRLTSNFAAVSASDSFNGTNAVKFIGAGTSWNVTNYSTIILKNDVTVAGSYINFDLSGACAQQYVKITLIDSSGNELDTISKYIGSDPHSPAADQNVTLQFTGLTAEEMTKVRGIVIGTCTYFSGYTPVIDNIEFFDSDPNVGTPVTTLLDFEDESVLSAVSGGTVVSSDATFTNSNYATLTDPGTAEFTFAEPVSISDTTLSMDVGHIFRTMSVKVSLMNGTTEVASASTKIINGEGTEIYQSESSIHTMFFDFSSSLTAEEMNRITGVKVNCSNNYMSPDLVFDNLKVVNSSDNGSGLFADFEDASNIRHYSNILITDGEDAISGTQSAKYFTNNNTTTDNYLAVRFNSAVSVAGKYMKFKVSGLGEDNLLSFTLYDSASDTTAIATASHTYYEDSDTYGSDRVKELYVEFTDLTEEEMSNIGGIIIRHYSWTTNKIAIDDIEFVAEEPTYDGYSTGEYEQEKFYLSTAMPYGYDSEYTGDTKTAIDNLAAANLNLVEFGAYNGKTDMIEYAGEKGLDVLASTSFRRSSDSKIPLDNTNLDWDLAARLELGKYQYNNVIGYLTYDEVSESEFSIANKLKTYINKWDPARLAYSCLLPSYNWYDPNNDTFDYSTYESYVNNYISTVNPQVLSFDYYPFNMGWSDVIERDWYRDMGLFRKTAKANNIPFWYYAGAVNGDNTALSMAEVNVQMNVALAYGAKYISLFGTNRYLYDAVTFEKAADFDAKAAFNKKVVNIGNLLFDKTSTAIYHTGGIDNEEYYGDNLSNCELLSSTSKFALSLTDKAIISVFEGADGKQYVMVVNKDIENSISNLSVSLSDTYSVAEFDSTNGTIGTAASVNSITLNIEAGGAAVYVIG